VPLPDLTEPVSPPLPPQAARPAAPSSAAGRVRRPWRRIDPVELAARTGMVWLLVALLIAAPLLYEGFWAWGNVRNLLAQNAPIGIIAVGMTYVMVAGGFDLSVGAIYAAGAVVFADLSPRMPILAALIATLAVGLAMGLVNGVVVTRLRVNPFIATLGSGSIFGGAAFLYSHSTPIVVDRPGFQTLGQGDWLGVPIPIWVGMAVFAAGALVLARSVYGQSLYAVGGNLEASRLAGLRVDVLRASTYVLVGGAAAFAGAMLASRIGVGQADVGTSITLEAIAIVVIGGTSLFGGEGAVWRSATGLLILAIITNVADSRGWDTNVEEVIKGIIIIGAVSIDAFARARRA
jgi:ribose transport system permease protein